MWDLPGPGFEPVSPALADGFSTTAPPGKSLCPFFDWVVCFFDVELHELFCLYTLESNPLLVASFANIFSHFVGCIFILFMISFAMQKLLSFIRSYLFIFIFIFIALGGGSKKILLQFMSESVLPVFLSKSFIVSSVMFSSLIHFKFIFLYGVSVLISFFYM